jgi:hypothetical protein
MRLDGGVDEVQAHAPLAHSTRLLAVMAVREAFVALQVTLSARQAAGSHPFRFIRSRRVRRS